MWTQKILVEYMYRRHLTASFILTFSLFISSHAQAQTFDSEHKHWSVFSLKQNGKKICYITSTPIKEDGNFTKRGEPYLLVTYNGNNVSEVSASSGYPYKKGTNVTINIDKKQKHSFFTSSETPKVAWAKDAKMDKLVISHMKKGNKMTVRGTSPKGTYSLDTYSLLGFSAATKRMISLCK